MSQMETYSFWVIVPMWAVLRIILWHSIYEAVCFKCLSELWNRRKGEKEYVPSHTWFWRVRFLLDFIILKQSLHLVLPRSELELDCGHAFQTGVYFGREGENAFFDEQLMLEILRFFFGHWRKSDKPSDVPRQQDWYLRKCLEHLAEVVAACKGYRSLYAERAVRK